MADWAACLAECAPAELAGQLYRLVESHEQVATNQLVSSLERQVVLEELLETTKPPLRKGTEGLHYLLATPFRYPPLKHGSRFGTRSEPSLFYGALTPATVLAEAAYYRFVFWLGMSVPPSGKLDTQHTLFEAAYQTKQGYRLQEMPFSRYQAELTHPSDYSSSQQLGSLMRNAGMQAFEYVSARDPQGGINIALFTPEALASNKPISQEPWLCELSAERVTFRAVHQQAGYAFLLEQFTVSGCLPWPA